MTNSLANVTNTTATIGIADRQAIKCHSDSASFTLQFSIVIVLLGFLVYCMIKPKKV
mgnify:CR=1 FL=1